MNKQSAIFSFRIVLMLLIFIVLVPLFPLLITHRWNWWEAWYYAAICILGFIISRVITGIRDPDVLRERSQFMKQKDAKPWDKILSPLLGLVGGLLPIVAGLDSLYNESFTYNMPIKIFSAILMFAGYTLGSWALIENRFFSGVVRIQTERGHHVVTTGPYHFIRHPGYAGGLLSYLATPLLLDSRWALLLFIMVLIVIVVRTQLEDRTLHNELEGYNEYAVKVRYRIFPGIW